jgi:hypothetical protein
MRKREFNQTMSVVCGSNQVVGELILVGNLPFNYLFNQKRDGSFVLEHKVKNSLLKLVISLCDAGELSCDKLPHVRLLSLQLSQFSELPFEMGCVSRLGNFSDYLFFHLRQLLLSLSRFTKSLLLLLV